MDDLEKVNEEIKKIKARERSRAWRKNNADKVRRQNKEWNDKKRVEYQRAYRAKSK